MIINIRKVTLVLSFLLMLDQLSFSQEADTTKSGNGGFGGPDQVDNQIQKDEEPKSPFFELGFMQPYFDFKTKLNEKSGFGYGMDYSAAYFSANNSLGDKDAGAGMIRFYASWDLVGRGKNNNGALIFKVEHRHKYTNLSIKDYGFNLGYVGMILPPFSDDQFRMTNFYWRQRVWQGRLSFVVGLLDATDYVDVYGMASPWMHFTNFAFSTGSETIYIPNDAALGIGVGLYITDHIYTIASISDAASDPTKPWKSFETFFSNSDYFKSVEVGWVKSKERHFFDNIHLTWWNSDGSEVTASLPGWGLAFSGTWFINDKIMPFLRGGFAEDGGTLLQKSVTAGLGWYQKKGRSLLGFAAGWGEINETTWDSGLSDQITMELFYRMQISSRLAITPDIQYIINPGLNPDASSIFLWGLRGRIVI